jgi:hypothetical protein
MEKITQLSVALENKPGQLGRMCRVLAQADVNIRAISISDAADISAVRLCVSNPATAKRALRESGLPFVTQEVVMVEVPDKPGALEDVAVRLGEAGVNINYIYSAGGVGDKAVLVLGVDDVAVAGQTLR